MVELESTSPSETRRVGERLGRLLDAGDVVLLRGALGAGKTAFTQGLALGLGVPRSRRVSSPTFTLVNEHAGRVPLYHLDLYRIDDPGELEEIGLREYLSGRGVAVIEWAEKLGDLVPAERIEVTLDITTPRSRRIRVEAVGARAAETVTRLGA